MTVDYLLHYLQDLFPTGCQELVLLPPVMPTMAVKMCQNAPLPAHSPSWGEIYGNDGWLWAEVQSEEAVSKSTEQKIVPKGRMDSFVQFSELDVKQSKSFLEEVKCDILTVFF